MDEGRRTPAMKAFIPLERSARAPVFRFNASSAAASRQVQVVTP